VETRHTTKGRLIRSVTCINTTTTIAGLRGVGGIDQYNRHACKTCFIVNKRTELPKRPISVSCAVLLPPNPHPFTNVLEVFKSDHALCVFGSSNQVLRYAVVGIFLELGLPSAQLAEATTTISCANSLQSLPTEMVAFANTVDLLTRMRIPITISSNMDYPKVNTDHTFNIIRCRFFYITHREEVELTFDVHQIRFTTTGLQELPLATTTHEWNGLATVNRPDGHRWCVQVPTQDTVVIREGTVLLEGASSAFIHLIGVCHFCDTPDNELCGQRKGGSDVFIALAVDVKLFEGLGIPRRLADCIARSITRFKCAQKRIMLFGCWLKFQLRNQFYHIMISIAHPYLVCKRMFGGRLSSVRAPVG